jgi:hypothetical protein
MNTKGIQQKLDLLPEGLAEENLRTWQLALEMYQRLCSMPVYSQVLTPVFEWAKEFSQSEQAKLFRAGVPGFHLTISTKEKHGLEPGDPAIDVDIDDERPEMLVISYFENGTEQPERLSCRNDEIKQTLQPLLDRLWNETRGKKSA